MIYAEFAVLLALSSLAELSDIRLSAPNLSRRHCV